MPPITKPTLLHALRTTWSALNPRPTDALRLLLALAILWSVRAPRVLVVPDPPQEVTTTNPLVGVHTRLTDEVERWKIQRTLRMVRKMGAPWIVEYFPWPYIEPEEGHVDWHHTDTVIEHAENQGLSVIARLGWVPRWARPEGADDRASDDAAETTLTYLDPDHYDDFADHVAAFAERYRGRVDHVIIWNEPNLSFEWGYRPVDPEAYVDLLREVYPRAHAANPDVVVLAGALAPTLEPEGSAAGMNDLVYLERIYQAGASPYFDALAVHAYGHTSPPGAPPAADAINFRRTELLRDIMEAHKDDGKPIYVTEAGWNDHPRWTGAVSPAERIDYTIEAYEWAREHWPWCRAVAMWAFRYPAPTYSYHDNYAFVTPDFDPHVIYLEVQEYAHATPCEGSIRPPVPPAPSPPTAATANPPTANLRKAVVTSPPSPRPRHSSIRAIPNSRFLGPSPFRSFALSLHRLVALSLYRYPCPSP